MPENHSDPAGQVRDDIAHLPGVAGVGIDLVHIPEFIAQLEEPGTRFLENFTAREIRACEARAAQTGQHFGHHLASRWAAKEAFLKAWSQSMYGAPPVLEDADMREIHVESDAWGRTRIVPTGAVAAAVGTRAHSVSLSHDGDTAVAVVVFHAGSAS